MQRVVLAARLLEGAHERAQELATSIDAAAGDTRFDRFSVYLSPTEVVFLAEAADAEGLISRMLNDPVHAAELSPWLPLFDGPLRRAHEAYHWSRERNAS